MLQLVLHLPPHPHQLVPMQQQLSQITLLRVSAGAKIDRIAPRKRRDAAEEN
jgi:hypothetical protein